MSDPALPTRLITVRSTDSTRTRLRMRLAKSFGTDQASLGAFEELGDFDNLAARPGGTASFLDDLWDFTNLFPDKKEDQIKAVRDYGEWLWRQLPSAFHEYYWSELHGLTGLSLAIWTDAMHFPWEMIWPTTPRAPFGRSMGIESLFGLTIAISRWPWHRSDLPTPAISPSPFIVYAPRNAAVGPSMVAECSSGAPECQDVENLRSKHGATLSAPATKARVLDTMRQGAGVLHIRTHGGFGGDDSWIEVDPNVDAGGAPGPCSNDGCLRAMEISGPFLKRTFVFLNSCQSGARRATANTEPGERRWANALTRAGCDAFLGHYWDVNEVPATRASELFYDRLKAGDTLGAAALAVRRKTLNLPDDEFTVDYLGYSLVGNPAQKIDF